MAEVVAEVKSSKAQLPSPLVPHTLWLSERAEEASGSPIMGLREVCRPSMDCRRWVDKVVQAAVPHREVHQEVETLEAHPPAPILTKGAVAGVTAVQAGTPVAPRMILGVLVGRAQLVQ